MAKQKVKKVGKINKKYIKKYNLKIHNNIIVQSLGLVYHAKKHINDFLNIDGFNLALGKISTIIEKPYYVYYDKNKNSIKYFGKANEYVCIVVNITNNENYVSTFYPISKKKIDKKRYENKK